MHLTQLVLPHRRAQRSVSIVNTTSTGGKICTPLGGWYHGTRFAPEALSDSLRREVAPLGVDVVVIEPGGIATEWGAFAADELQQASVAGTGACASQAAAVVRSLRSEADANRSSPLRVIADAIGRATTTAEPRTRYAVGSGPSRSSRSAR